MNHKRVLAAAAMVAALAGAGIASSAHAAQIGFYIGGQYGQGSKESSIQDFDVFAQQNYDQFGFTVESGTSTLDDSDAGYGFIAGYRFTPHLAVEGGYLDLGNLKYRSRVNGNIGGVPSDGAFNVDSETSGIAVSALGVWPLSYRWEVYGRGGVLFASNTASLFYADIQGPARGEFSENSIDALVGVGTSLTFLEIYDFRLEYQRVFDAGDEATAEGDVDMVSLGITVVF
jgi:opacity protein-like surface antigen